MVSLIFKVTADVLFFCRAARKRLDFCCFLSLSMFACMCLEGCVCACVSHIEGEATSKDKVLGEFEKSQNCIYIFSTLDFNFGLAVEVGYF